MKRIVIFASGNGTNAQRIITYFKDRADARVVQLLTNNPHAKVLERAKTLNIPAFSFNKSAFYHTEQVLTLLKSIQPDCIVLAGFLWLFPKNIIAEFPDQILNIHPALLPNFGGKGMYGKYVHEAVFAFAKAETSKNPAAVVHTGITIHKVTPEYDKGEHIFQAKVAVAPLDTPETIAQKVHQLEHNHFPEVIEHFLSTQV